MAPSRSPDPQLHRLAESLSARWLAAQRWFRGKSRLLDRVELSDAARFPGGEAWLLVLTATDGDGVASHYLVPAMAGEGGFREPRDGEGVWRSMVARIASGGELRGVRGSFAFEPTAALPNLLGEAPGSLGALVERRLAVEQSNTSSPLRDLAGMLRSLDYAAHVAHRDRGGPLPDSWLPQARAAFLSGYGGLTSAEERLCTAFEIEKACYEIRYEANNRPDWLWLPLAALERLAV